MLFPFRPGVDAAWLPLRPKAVSPTSSSLFAGAVVGGAGDATESTALFGLSSLSAEVGVEERNRLLLRLEPLTVAPLLTAMLDCGAGEA